MKVLFDEDVPRKLARFLPQHDIQTVVSMEWGGVKNGALLILIEREDFQAFLTGDKNMACPRSTGRWSGPMFTQLPPPSMRRDPALLR